MNLESDSIFLLIIIWLVTAFMFLIEKKDGGSDRIMTIHRNALTKCGLEFEMTALGSLSGKGMSTFFNLYCSSLEMRALVLKLDVDHGKPLFCKLFSAKY